MDFDDLARFLGKSGMDLIHPPTPQLCAGLLLIKIARVRLSAAPDSCGSRIALPCVRQRTLMQVRRAHLLRAVIRIIRSAGPASSLIRVPERALDPVRRAHRLRAVIHILRVADLTRSILLAPVRAFELVLRAHRH